MKETVAHYDEDSDGDDGGMFVTALPDKPKRGGTSASEGRGGAKRGAGKQHGQQFKPDTDHTVFVIGIRLFYVGPSKRAKKLQDPFVDDYDDRVLDEESQFTSTGAGNRCANETRVMTQFFFDKTFFLIVCSSFYHRNVAKTSIISRPASRASIDNGRATSNYNNGFAVARSSTIVSATTIAAPRAPLYATKINSSMFNNANHSNDDGDDEDRPLISLSSNRPLHQQAHAQAQTHQRQQQQQQQRQPQQLPPRQTHSYTVNNNFDSSNRFVSSQQQHQPTVTNNNNIIPPRQPTFTFQPQRQSQLQASQPQKRQQPPQQRQQSTTASRWSKYVDEEDEESNGYFPSVIIVLKN